MISERSQQRETAFAVIRRGVRSWRVYYGDGSFVSSDDVAWEDCPSDDVQVVLQFRLSPTGDRLWCDVLSGDDEYKLEGSDHVKVGQYATWETYDRIFNEAKQYVTQEFKSYGDGILPT